MPTEPLTKAERAALMPVSSAMFRAYSAAFGLPAWFRATEGGLTIEYPPKKKQGE